MCKVRDRTQKIKRSKIDLKGVLRYTFQMTDRNKEKKNVAKIYLHTESVYKNSRTNRISETKLHFSIHTI